MCVVAPVRAVEQIDLFNRCWGVFIDGRRLIPGEAVSPKGFLTIHIDPTHDASDARQVERPLGLNDILVGVAALIAFDGEDRVRQGEEEEREHEDSVP